MLRSDRSTSSLRPLSINLESLDRVDGSGAFAFGETKALASVSGPIQVRLAIELPSKASFEVIVRPLSGIPGTESKALATTLRTLLTPSLVLTQNPRTLIQLVVQLLAPSTNILGQSLMAAAINASSIALIRASSFPMLGVVCAAAVGRAKASSDAEERILLLDPTEEEVQQCDAAGCVAVMFRSSPTKLDGMDEDVDVDADEDQGDIVWSSFQGLPLHTDYDTLLRLAKSGARSVYQAMRKHIQAKTLNAVIQTEQKAKKVPRHKGGRVALSVGPEDAMDIT